MLKIIKEIIGYLLVKTHRLSNDEQTNILSVFFHNPPKKLFGNILKWLNKNGYKVISLDEFNNIIQQKIAVEKIAIITFDDGWIGNLELLDLIEKYKAPVAIFIPTDAVVNGNYWFEYARLKGQERFTQIKDIQDFKQLPTTTIQEKVGILKRHYELSRSCVTLDQLNELNRNKWVTIGSHTVNHPILKQCSNETQEYELQQSKKVLMQWLNTEIEYLAFPNGDYNEHTIKTAGHCDYKLCFTIHPENVNVNKVNPYLIPRRCIDDNGGYYESLAKILGIWQKYFSKKGSSQVASNTR